MLLACQYWLVPYVKTNLPEEDSLGESSRTMLKNGKVLEKNIENIAGSIVRKNVKHCCNREDDKMIPESPSLWQYLR